jgi:hypothetical protein
MPAVQHQPAVDAWLALFDDWERLWRRILKHELHPTLKMD